MNIATNADASLGRLEPSGMDLTKPIVQWTVLGCVGVVLLAAAVLLWRRAAGALAAPLPLSALVAVGLAMAASAAAVRSAWAWTSAPRGWALAVSVALTISTLAVAAAVSLPSSSLLGLGVLWLAVVGETAWAWRPSRRERRGRPVRSRPKQQQDEVPTAESDALFSRAVTDSALGEEMPREHVTQQLTRVEEPDGSDRVVGWMRVSFEPGQRLASVHVAFCPPFQRTPEAVLERLDGPQFRIKSVQVLPFGARFDLKLSTAAEQPVEALLQFGAELAGREAWDSDSETEEEHSPP